MSVSVTQLIERFLGPSMTSDYTGCFQRGRFTGWFSAPGTDGTYWVVGLGESRDEARRVSRETRAELAELLQGKGVAVDLRDWPQVQRAIEDAGRYCDQVVVEQFVSGVDLRLVVVDYRIAAAAIRVPAMVTGNGRSSVRELIAHQSRRRAAATGGESKIPLDAETERCVADAGYRLDAIPAADARIIIRKTANLHTGGTIHDVTDRLHPDLAEAAIRVARTIDIPVTGIDFIVAAPERPEYWFIEANERPGLANHEPQPTAERFIDLLFPQSRPVAMRAETRG